MNKREEIVDKLNYILSNIKKSNGYRTDLGNKIIYMHEIQDPKNKIDYLLYADGNEKYEIDNNLMQSELDIDIQIVRYGFEYSTLINDSIDDILKCILKDRSLGLSGCVIEPVDSVYDLDFSGRDFVVLQLKFKVTYIVKI